MEDIVEVLRDCAGDYGQFHKHVGYGAADEIESLRAQLAEVTRERDGLIRAVADHVTVRGEYYQQLLATQAHAALLVEALANLNESARMCQAGEQDKDSIQLERTRAIEILSAPINLDALCEHDAQLLRGTAEKWKSVEGVSPYEFLINEAAAHRAKKDSY